MDITDQGAQMEPLLPTVSPAARRVYVQLHVLHIWADRWCVCVCVFGEG